MRVARHLVLALIGALLALAAVAPPPAGAVTLAEKRALLRRELASSAVFRQMEAARTRAPYNSFDWSTDGCSWAPDRPAGFDFRAACRRHDFNYRNFRAVGIFTSADRAAIDAAFLGDLRAACPATGARRTACLGLASTYHQAVRRLG